MGWPEARDAIIAIVEGVTVTTKKGGMPGRFRYLEDADMQGPVPDSRAFWFATTPSMAVTGPLMPSAQAGRARVEIELVISYAVSLTPGLALEVMLEDYDAVGRALRDDTGWDRPDSTIESIDVGGDRQGRARIEKNDDGTHFLIFEIPLEYRG